MSQPSATSAVLERPAPATPEQPKPPVDPADAALNAYVGLLAGWFDIGRLVAGRRLDRSGVRHPLLNDG